MWGYTPVRTTGVLVFNFLTFGHSGAHFRECPNVKKIRNGTLDQYGPECFGILARIRKKCGNERVNEEELQKE